MILKNENYNLIIGGVRKSLPKKIRHEEYFNSLLNRFILDQKSLTEKEKSCLSRGLMRRMEFTAMGGGGISHDDW